jgi:hypothetical protein
MGITNVFDPCAPGDTSSETITTDELIRELAGKAESFRLEFEPKSFGRKTDDFVVSVSIEGCRVYQRSENPREALTQAFEHVMLERGRRPF